MWSDNKPIETIRDRNAQKRWRHKFAPEDRVQNTTRQTTNRLATLLQWTGKRCPVPLTLPAAMRNKFGISEDGWEDVHRVPSGDYGPLDVA